MSIAYKCKCGRVGQVADKYAGETIACPDCKSPVKMPPPPPPIAKDRTAWSLVASTLAGVALGSIGGFTAAEFIEPQINTPPPAVESTPEQVAVTRLTVSRGLGVDRDQMVGELEDVYRFQNVTEDGDSMMFQIGNGVTVIMRGPEDDVSSVVVIGSHSAAHFTDMARAMMTVSKQVWHDRQWLAEWLEVAFSKVDPRFGIHTSRAGVNVALNTASIDDEEIVILELHKSETAPPTPSELRL